MIKFRDKHSTDVLTYNRLFKEYDSAVIQVLYFYKLVFFKMNFSFSINTCFILNTVHCI